MNRAKNTFIKRFLSMAIICCVLSMSLIGLERTTVSARVKPTSGKDNNGNKWTYNKSNKTLTFSGKKDIGTNYFERDGESAEPIWFAWQDETKTLNIKSGITGLTDGVFQGFDKLEIVSVPNSVTYIGYDTFGDCMKLKKIKMPNNISKIGSNAFGCCYDLQSIVIPYKVKKIGERAFRDCHKLKSISLPNSVKKLGSGAFANCENLKKVRLSENLKEISEELFGNCKRLKSITIPKSIKKIGGAAFIGAGIDTITIPVNVTSFVKSFYGEGMFEECKKLKKVIIKTKKLTRVDKTVFEGFNEKAVIEVPKSKLTKYRQMFYKSGLSKKVKIKAFD